MSELVRHLIVDEDGQDLIEYALLASTVGLAGVGLFPIIQAKIGTNFQQWGTNVNGIWIPPNPGP